MTFNRADFDTALDDIEKYLGYLKGNELAYKYLMDQWGQILDECEGVPGPPVGISLDWDYKFPCPEERFKVRPGTHWAPQVRQDMDSGRMVDWDAYVKEVQHQTDLTYKSGTAWAAGISGYLRSICAQFVEPDVVSLRDTCLDFHHQVVMPLADVPNDDFAHLGLLNARWTGAAAAAFNDFYENYNDSVARCALYANYVNVGFGAAAKVIASTQVGAQEFVTKMREGLVAQLDQWSHVGWKPNDPPDDKFPKWVTNLVDVAENTVHVAADFIPVVGEAVEKAADVKEKIADIKGLVGSVATLTGADLPKTHKAIPVKTSDEIYTSLTNHLYDDYLSGYQKAMEKLDSAKGKFSGHTVLKDMKSDKQSGNWDLPDVSPTKLNDEGDQY